MHSKRRKHKYEQEDGLGLIRGYKTAVGKTTLTNYMISQDFEIV